MMAPLDTNESSSFAENHFRSAPPPLTSSRKSPLFKLLLPIETDLTEDNPPSGLHALRLEANFLDLFGMRPCRRQRVFTRDEDRQGAPPVVMISYALWRHALRQRSERRLALAPCRSMACPPLSSACFRRISKCRRSPEPMWSCPLRSMKPPNAADAPSAPSLRMRPGLSMVESALAELQPQFQRALETVPARFRKEVSRCACAPVRDRQVGDRARRASLALFGAVLAVLLDRVRQHREPAHRLRGDARRANSRCAPRSAPSRCWRLARQTLTESLLLSALGAIAGCALAGILLRVFVSLAPRRAAPLARGRHRSPRAALHSMRLAGLGPALRPRPALRRSGLRSPSADRAPPPQPAAGLRAALVTLEIAFSMALVTGAGLCIAQPVETRKSPAWHTARTRRHRSIRAGPSALRQPRSGNSHSSTNWSSVSPRRPSRGDRRDFRHASAVRWDAREAALHN